jgi:hypothetical protein
MGRIRIAVPVLSACLVLAGCGQSGGDPDPRELGGADVTPSATSEPGPTAEPGPIRRGDPTLPPPQRPSQTLTPGGPGVTPEGGLMTITGTITEGVEVGCLLLDGYLLIGGDKQVIRAGAQVTVTGQIRPDIMTTCQQGTPFQVRTVKPA